MDLKPVVALLKDLGLPAAISAVLTVLVKAILDSRQRSSKDSLLEWLSRPESRKPFKGDNGALRALDELQKSLVFERAFKLRAESAMRDQLLQFADLNRENMRFQEVLDAGRLVGRLSARRLQSPVQARLMRTCSKAAKPLGFLYFVLGYVILIGGMYLPLAFNWTGQLFLASYAFGSVFGALLVYFGGMMLKIARRFEISASFLTWRKAHLDHSFGQGNESSPRKPSGAA